MNRFAAFTFIGSILGGCLTLGAAPVGAVTQTPDDRLQAAPVTWWTYRNLTAAEVSQKLSENKARPTDLRVENGTYGQWKFTVTMVANVNSYQTDWWWYYDKTRAELDTLLPQLEKRPISVQRYWDSSRKDWRYAAVAVSQLGSGYNAWLLKEGDSNAIDTAVNNYSGYRLSAVSEDACNISVNCTPSGSHFVAVLNGNPDHLVSKWYHGKTADELGSLTKGNQLVDLDPTDAGTFNAVAYSTPWSAWSWTFGTSAEKITETAKQHGGRVVDLTSYHKGGSLYYAGIITENLNGLSAQLRDLYNDPALNGASYGFKLKEWGGGTVASLQEDKQFDPASALKTLHHLHTMRAEQLGKSSGTDLTLYHYKAAKYPDYTTADESGICPTDTNVPNVDFARLDDVDKEMMHRSDNRMTRAIYELYDDGTAFPMNKTISDLGIQGDTVRLAWDCGATKVHTTLNGLEKIMEAGYLSNSMLDSTYREKFRSGMESGASPLYFSVVFDEAYKLGIDPKYADDFNTDLYAHSPCKGGSVQGGDGDDRATSCVIGLPHKFIPGVGGSDFKFYTWGEFMNTTDTNPANWDKIDEIRAKVYTEAFRPLIRQALIDFSGTVAP